MSMIGASIFAHDIEVVNAEGKTIYYVWGKNKTELAVSSCGISYYSYSNEYSGNVIIPESVYYNGIKYNVTSIGKSAFRNCIDLISITIPNSVTIIGDHAFCGCSGLISIMIPNSVRSIGNDAFSYCSGLTSITIPNSVTNLGWGTFWGCSGLTSITIPNSVRFIDDSVFADCSGLTSINVESGNQYYDSRNNCNAVIESSSNKLIVGCQNTIIPNNVTCIEDYAFWGCSGLASITIPKSVMIIRRSAFSNCSGLTSISVENGNQYYDSRNNCNAIIESSSNTMIAGCKSTIIPNSVTSIENAFCGCSGLTSVMIPNSVTSIGDDAFLGCSGLISITVETGNTAYDSRENCNGIIKTEMNTLMVGCQNTTIPNSVTSIGDYAFYQCTGLTSITIPNSVTSIGNYAFQNCTDLTSVKIGNSVGRIGSYAFGNCKNLTDVFCIAEYVYSVDYYAFYFSNAGNATLHVPEQSIDRYRSLFPWNTFGSIVPLTSEELSINSIDSDGYSDMLRFTLDGKRTNSPQKGLNIIKTKNGQTRKIIAK